MLTSFIKNKDEQRLLTITGLFAILSESLYLVFIMVLSTTVNTLETYKTVLGGFIAFWIVSVVGVKRWRENLIGNIGVTLMLSLCTGWILSFVVGIEMKRVMVMAIGGCVTANAVKEFLNLFGGERKWM